jgi:hypothetical protein
MRNIIIIIIFAFTAGVFSARGQSGGDGQHQVSLLLGRGMFYTGTDYMRIGKNATLVQAPSRGVQQTLTLSDPNSNSLLNMMGVEYKFHVTDQISASFSGAGFISNTPWRDAVDGLAPEPGSVLTGIPKYETVDAELMSRFVGALGGQYYMGGGDRVRPYAGAQFMFQFASLSARSTYSGFEDSSIEDDLKDMGMRTGQTVGLSPSIVAGVEYSLAPGLTVGFEFKPFSFYYSGVQLFAQPGLNAMTFVSQDFSFLAQPVFKIGFQF